MRMRVQWASTYDDWRDRFEGVALVLPGFLADVIGDRADEDAGNLCKLSSGEVGGGVRANSATWSSEAGGAKVVRAHVWLANVWLWMTPSERVKLTREPGNGKGKGKGKGGDAAWYEGTNLG